MATTPVFIRKSMPDRIGYNDTALIYKNDIMVFEGDGSTCPNPYSPSRYGLVWTEAYAMIECGRFKYECIEHSIFGKCLLINDGKVVPTCNPNRNHGSKYYATEIFVHSGGLKSSNKEWRGSAGCLTIHPDLWPEYIGLFNIADSGYIIISDKENFSCEDLIAEENA